MRLNGIGTMWLGATRRDGQDRCHATLWFTFLFAPLVPLRRARLQLLPHRGDGFGVRELERTPLEVGELVRTWLFSLVFVPAVAFGPLVPAVEEVRRAVGMPESWQVPWLVGAIIWLAAAAWILMEWHQRRFHPGAGR